MNGIDELERMLESRSTDYGRMRQILAFYKLGVDKSLADLRKSLKAVVDLCDTCCCCRKPCKTMVEARQVLEKSGEEVKKSPKRPLANGCCAHNPWGYSKPFSIGFGKTPEEIAETFEKMKEASR